MSAPVGLEYKNVASPDALSADTAGALHKGVIEALVAVTGVKDDVGDVIVPGAFRSTLETRKPKVCLGHDWNRPIGKTLQIKELMPGDPALPKTTAEGKPWPREAGAVWAQFQTNMDIDDGKNAFHSAKFYGPESTYSIGYKATTAKHKAGTRYIHELDLFEFGPVLHPANRLATLQSIKSGEPEEIEYTDLDMDEEKSVVVEELTLRDYAAILDIMEEKAVKIRRVSATGSAYWGMPVGTIIKPGMKPQGTGKGGTANRGLTTVKPAGAPKPRAVKVGEFAVARDGYAGEVSSIDGNSVTISKVGESPKTYPLADVGVGVATPDSPVVLKLTDSQLEAAAYAFDAYNLDADELKERGGKVNNKTKEFEIFDLGRVIDTLDNELDIMEENPDRKRNHGAKTKALRKKLVDMIDFDDASDEPSDDTPAAKPDKPAAKPTSEMGDRFQRDLEATQGATLGNRLVDAAPDGEAGIAIRGIASSLNDDVRRSRRGSKPAKRISPEDSAARSQRSFKLTPKQMHERADGLEALAQALDGLNLSEDIRDDGFGDTAEYARRQADAFRNLGGKRTEGVQGSEESTPDAPAAKPDKPAVAKPETEQDVRRVAEELDLEMRPNPTPPDYIIKPPPAVFNRSGERVMSFRSDIGKAQANNGQVIPAGRVEDFLRTWRQEMDKSKDGYPPRADWVLAQMDKPAREAAAKAESDRKKREAVANATNEELTGQAEFEVDRLVQFDQMQAQAQAEGREMDTEAAARVRARGAANLDIVNAELAKRGLPAYDLPGPKLSTKPTGGRPVQEILNSIPDNREGGAARYDISNGADVLDDPAGSGVFAVGPLPGADKGSARSEWAITLGNGLAIPASAIVRSVSSESAINVSTPKKVTAWLKAMGELRGADGNPPPYGTATAPELLAWRDADGRSLKDALTEVVAPAYLKAIGKSGARSGDGGDKTKAANWSSNPALAATKLPAVMFSQFTDLGQNGKQAYILGRTEGDDHATALKRAKDMIANAQRSSEAAREEGRRLVSSPRNRLANLPTEAETGDPQLTEFRRELAEQTDDVGEAQRSGIPTRGLLALALAGRRLGMEVNPAGYPAMNRDLTPEQVRAEARERARGGFGNVYGMQQVDAALNEIDTWNVDFGKDQGLMDNIKAWVEGSREGEAERNRPAQRPAVASVAMEDGRTLRPIEKLTGENQALGITSGDYTLRVYEQDTPGFPGVPWGYEIVNNATGGRQRSESTYRSPGSALVRAESEFQATEQSAPAAPEQTATITPELLDEAAESEAASVGLSETPDGALEVDVDVAERQDRVEKLIKDADAGKLKLSEQSTEDLTATRRDLVDELRLQTTIQRRAPRAPRPAADTPKVRPGLAGAAEDHAEALRAGDAAAIERTQARLRSSIRRSRVDSEIARSLADSITSPDDNDADQLSDLAKRLRAESRERRNASARKRRTAKRIERARLQSLISDVDTELGGRGVTVETLAPELLAPDQNDTDSGSGTAPGEIPKA